jgi:hypothetical protein
METKKTFVEEIPVFPGLFNVGLNKREYFAIMAMQGLLHNLSDELSDTQEDLLYLAERAVNLADALWAELRDRHV